MVAKGEENTTAKARMFLSVQPTISRNEASNALKRKEAILDEKQTISLTTYTLNPDLRGPAALLSILRNTCGDSIAKLYCVFFFFLGGGGRARDMWQNRCYRTGVPVWN